jgi:multimeric flavodoxin WrbA
VDDFVQCNAIAIGSPNYFSYMAGLMKDFFDKALSIREKVADKPAAAFTSGGGASNSALLSLERMITSFRLRKIIDGIVSSGVPSSEDLLSCKQMGEALARAASDNAALPTE